MSEKIKVVAIVGPTASGKTSLSIELAKLYGGEIIGADSMQIYKGMPIASAAPTEDEKGDIPHHLFEILEPCERFSVADYCEIATNTIKETAARGKLPIIVGGAGLYIDSLLSGMNFSEEEGTAEIRKKLTEEANTLGAKAMLDRLEKIDAVAAAKLHPNDTKRIIRALEVYMIHGITPTEMNKKTKSAESPFDFVKIGITYKDREKLYSNIGKRVDMMVEKGLIDEARSARENLGNTAVQAIGHKELYPYIDGEISLDEALENLKRATRRYAKRQLTWFKRDENIRWIYRDNGPSPTDTAKNIIDGFLI